jgi:beta-N-acetylhexosaminidase
MAQIHNSKPVMLTPLGSEWTLAEHHLYAKYNPYGFILFGKHCETPDQVKKLCFDIRSSCGDDTVIAIDQEGGRVARMRGPHWPEFPAAANMNDVYDVYYKIGQMLADCGVTMDFAPCLDVVPKGARADAIGDRCFSSDPAIVGKSGIDACRGLLDARITPVIKHMPGHGRAVEDTHYFLPFVDANENELNNDLSPFKTIIEWDVNNQVAGMTAHLLFKFWNKETPVTLCNKTIKSVIRDYIGFNGLLFSDDLTMKALDQYGDIVQRVHLCLQAGCDIALPCHTDLDESRKILESLS